MFTGSAKELTDLARRFTEPANATHRQYEALRAYFVEGLSGVEAARRFGYTPGSFRVLVHQFRRDPDRTFWERSERIGPLERGSFSPTRSLIIVVSRPTRRKGNDHVQAQTQPTANARKDPTATARSPRGDPGRDPGRPAADRNPTPRGARDPHRRRFQVLGTRPRGTDPPTVGPPDGRGDASRPRRLGEPAPGPLLGSRGGPHDQGSRPT